jgi:hypothetical protein
MWLVHDGDEENGRRTFDLSRDLHSNRTSKRPSWLKLADGSIGLEEIWDMVPKEGSE